MLLSGAQHDDLDIYMPSKVTTLISFSLRLEEHSMLGTFFLTKETGIVNEES